MQVPSTFKGDYLKRFVQGAAVGFIATVAIGFSWFGFGFGWTLGGTAEQMAAQRVNDKVVELYTPVCVQRFEQQADLPAKWVAYKKIDDYARESFIQDTGFATPPGSKNANPDVASACATKLTDISNKQGPVAQK